MFAESDASVVRPIPGPSQAGGGSPAWERQIWAATVAGMTLLAIAWMAYQSHRYFFVSDAGQPRRATAGAIDVRNRFDETRS
ncbi:MAG TPA: hypothetical protein DDY91_14285 [Planctomycetaceae bacterium]|nr:hypothetical protein [Planctomycetaceae bacterium]